MDNTYEKLINRVLDGRYKIENVVGIGGMAYVLKAIDLQKDNMPVAIKVLNEEFYGDENAVKRFVNESEAVKLVNSPHVVKIYDVAMSDNLKYIVMEFIDGITLKDYIDKVGALSWKEAVHYVRQILRGLSHAHEKGVVHRDIKPQNMMLLRDGTVKVTDFGIAKMPTSEPLTMTDKAIGTVNYISPEQASGNKVDEKSDLYSVGVMLYEMLTGTLPFKSDSPVAVAMMQVSEEPVKPREINSQIPVGLEQIILKAMSKDPEARFSCAAAMEKALEYFVKNPEVVFSGVPASAGGKVTQKNEDGKDDDNKSRSMFPIILGITISFIVLCLAVGIVLVIKAGVKPEDGFAGALDKIFNVDENNSDKNKIPLENCIGMEYTEQLKKDLEAKGYRVVIKDGEDRNQPNGIILRQDPDPEVVKEIKDPKRVGSNTRLTLYINRIPGTYVRMPDCLDMNLEIAKDMIVEAFDGAVAITDIKETEMFGEGTKGTVIKCIPEPGTSIDISNIPNIKLYVCKGYEPEEVEMPDIVGLPKDEALSILKSNKILSYREEREYSDEPANTVIKIGIETEEQTKEIKAGDKFMNDARVVVYISMKDRGESFKVPNVIGMDLDDAKSKIINHFRITESELIIIRENNEDIKKNEVYKIEPAVNTQITDFTSQKITLYVSLGPVAADTVMPKVVNKPLDVAMRLLDNANLTDVDIEYKDSEEDEDTVISANYSAGAKIKEDYKIVLEVSNGNSSGAEDEMDKLMQEAGRTTED